MTYTATLSVPTDLTAVMSAAPGVVQADGRVRFDMPQPIPPYLLALAVGELESRELGPRTRVFAEPAVIEAAAWEFADVERMLETAEGLFGPYAWERFDFIVLPASFPLGGMENPRMTFLTPTLIAGDRSLVGVLAHELAHSWTGNLVTNADNEHFWLNEGWTVYAERRILEALYGSERATQAAALGRQHLDSVIESRQASGRSTALTYSQEGLHPDDEFSQVPYEKGFLLVTALEQAVGREAFDVFIGAYIETFRFQSIDTQTFVDFVAQQLGPVLDLDPWLHGQGLPEDAPVFTSERLKQLHGLADRWTEGARPDASDMSVTERLYYLSCLPVLDADSVEALDASLGLRLSKNAELRSVWLSLAARAELTGEDDAIQDFVATIGRTKLLAPVVRSLVAAKRRPFAVALIDANRERLHGSTVRSLTRWVEEAPST
ncbi:MAG: aminopeptidase N [Myxococcota bacterium]|jgi:aminopeptidase N